VIIQIYTAQSEAEARSLADLGVDHVGLTVAERGLPGEIDLATGRDIVAVLEGVATSIALTVDTDPMAVRMLAATLEPDILHLCGDTRLFPPSAVADLREWLEKRRMPVALLQAIPVTGPEAVVEARRFARHVDWLLLDSVTDQVEGIGAAGMTHDWSISRRIVEESDVPVILAGGLGPDNVAEAIAAVQPAGVDSLTRTNRALAGGRFEKDLAAVAHFISAARSLGGR
jgi:phosphoribosylanthranilate isomerase